MPISMLLDIVEVARSHSGLNLAAAFTKILDDFGISDKVRYLLLRVPFRESFFYPQLSTIFGHIKSLGNESKVWAVAVPLLNLLLPHQTSNEFYQFIHIGALDLNYLNNTDLNNSIFAF